MNDLNEVEIVYVPLIFDPAMFLIIASYCTLYVTDYRVNIALMIANL